MVKHFSKKYGNREELSTNCKPKVMPRCLSALPHEQAAKTDMASMVRIKYLVLCTVEDGVSNSSICLIIHP